MLVQRFHHCEIKYQNQKAAICEVRKTYWVPQIRRSFKSMISKCHVCRSMEAEPRASMTGQLPKNRLNPCGRPLENTGVDYFGPLNVTVGCRSEKRWVALFTRLPIRAIHLELAHDLSMDSIIIALRNFINRRGIRIRMRSDNGKNFVDANEEAKRFDDVFEASQIQT